MGLEVALEVENLELIALAEGEELAEGGIRLDNLLIHQLVRLGVRAHTARDLRAAQERALGEAKERAERFRDGDRAGEDRLLLGAVRGTLDLTAAAALGGLLELTGNLLLELLHVGEDRGQRRTERVHLLDERRELGCDIDLLGCLRRRHSRDGRNSSDGRSDRGNDGSDRHLRGLGGCSRGDGRGNSGGDRGGGNRDGGLAGLGNFGGCGGHFYIGVWGSFWLKQTRGYAFLIVKKYRVNFDPPGGRKSPKPRDAALYLVCFPT